ncbi:transposase [Streptomyces sp. NPDC056244]|uniref:transposase n=1 Tax=Streptomyces sp. NPDC056244 TaxID=3345762 RepID=UPI0035DDAB63
MKAGPLGSAEGQSVRRALLSDRHDGHGAGRRPRDDPEAGVGEGRGGRPEEYCHRDMLDTIPYMVDNGVKWPAPPADYPPWKTVHGITGSGACGRQRIHRHAAGPASDRHEPDADSHPPQR